MAKGDAGRVQNAVDYQGGLAQNNLNNVRSNTNNLFGQMGGNYNAATSRNIPDYDSMMSNYRSFLGGSNPGMQQTSSSGTGKATLQASSDNPLDSGNINNQLTQYYQSLGKTPTGRGTGPTDIAYYTDQIANTGGLTPDNAGYWSNRIQSDMNGGQGNANTSPGTSIGGYQNFAQTGGFSPQDIQNFRARAIAPTRAIYQNAQDELQRNRALQGGYSPNMPAAMAKMAREQSQGISDANVNADTAIGQLMQQGKLAGLSGLTGAQLGAMGGMNSLFGTNPGLSQTFGQQALGANTQNIDVQQLQNAIMQNTINGQLGRASVPGNFQQAMGNIGSVLGAAGNVAGGLSGLGMFGNPYGAQGIPGGQKGPF